MRRIRFATIVVVALTATACGSGDVPSIPAPRAGLDAELERVPLSSISLTRAGCFGSCPAYEVTYHRSGTVHYVGRAFVPFVGEREGSLASQDFVELAHWVAWTGIGKRDHTYGMKRIDLPVTTIEIMYRDGRSTKVVEYEPGSSEFWLLERVLDGLMADVSWRTAG